MTVAANVEILNTLEGFVLTTVNEDWTIGEKMQLKRHLLEVRIMRRPQRVHHLWVPKSTSSNLFNSNMLVR